MSEARTIPFARPWVEEGDRQAVMAVLKGDVLTHGPQGKALEEEFAAFLGGGAHCVSTSSGMAALHLSYWQLGIGPGDEVLVAAQTHTATAHAVEVVGARPVFVDCDPATGNLTPEGLEAALTPRTRAIGLVHFLGVPCDMEGIMDLARRRDLRVIEDCALAVGSRFGGTHVGLYGDAGCFSFYPVKHLTTGDGGMFITHRAELAAQVHKARGFGVDRTFAERSVPGMYDVPTLGLNYRMSDINAALGRSQLRRVGEVLARRRRNFDHLSGLLAGLPGVSTLGARDERGSNSHYCLCAVLEGDLAGRRDRVIAGLNRRGVGTSIYYPHPVPRLKYYRQKYGYAQGAFPGAERISDQSISLPVGPHLGEEEVEYIGAVFAQVIREEQ
ncbi:MAG: DegT/DnrJ/EryC1/StrS family aminotransferase [Candidatus Handelsmanbacteria bacterium]|nr:DegT/DnrJ/EryC1/StrS family aminotransferase [Candidatus Handelsmanbacteria bacterium]